MIILARNFFLEIRCQTEESGQTARPRRCDHHPRLRLRRISPVARTRNPEERRASRARTRAKNVQRGEEMIYYRPGELKEIQTKTSKRDDFIRST